MTDLAERDLTTESKGERTRRRILEIAIERFGERGYRATSVSEIARAAGLTQAASYAYFDSKESLFQAAVDADAEGLISDVAAQAQGRRGAPEAPRAEPAADISMTGASLIEWSPNRNSMRVPS